MLSKKDSPVGEDLLKQKENEKPVLLNSDYYKPKKQVVKVGTKKAVTEEKENND